MSDASKFKPGDVVVTASNNVRVVGSVIKRHVESIDGITLDAARLHNTGVTVPSLAERQWFVIDDGKIRTAASADRNIAEGWANPFGGDGDAIATIVDGEIRVPVTIDGVEHLVRPPMREAGQ